MKRLVILLLVAVCMLVHVYADNGLEVSSTNSSIAQNFDDMWNTVNNEATLTLPTGWRIDRQMDAPRKVGSFAAASTTVMYSGGVSLASNASNGTWNFGSSSNPSDRAIGGLSTTVSNGTRCVSVMTQLTNADTEAMGSLTISYDIEKYRKGDNAAGFTVQLYYSTDGSRWTSAGDDFKTTFDPDDATSGAEVVPIATVSVNEKTLKTNIAAGESIYLAWNISVASGTSPNKAMGLALDNIAIQASFGNVDPNQGTTDEPTFTPSGIYLRGEVNGWTADADWEFSDEGEGTYVLYNKELSGGFKVADASWSSACNYGTNGTSITLDTPYSLVLGTNDNITCGGNTYACKKIILSIADGKATLLLQSDDDATGLTSVYVVGDHNGWNYMDKSGELKFDEADQLFKGQISLPAAADGLSHWRIYQRLGMAGSWGAQGGVSTTGNITQGTLEKGSTANISTEPGTYDFTFNLTTGDFTLTRQGTVIESVTLMPADVTLVKALPEKVKVLSLNNSLIYYNDQDAMFNDIAAAMGKDAQWTKHTLLGKSLATHWSEGDGLAEDGNPGAKMLIRNEAWSHIILQEQSALPRTGIETFRASLKQWVAYIREFCPNPNAIIIVPMNWAYSSDWDHFTDFNNQFYVNYQNVARETGVTLCPVGRAYQAAFDAEGAQGLASWFLDDRHPSNKSTYMAACMEYGLIFGEDPATISYHPTTVSDDDAAAMRSYASQTLKGFTNYVDHTAGTVRYTAVAVDQFGMETDAPADLTYTLTGNGTLDEHLVFTSDGTEGTSQINAKNARFDTSATVKVAHAETTVVTYPAMQLDADNLSVGEDFNTMGTSAEASLPEAWRIDRQAGGPRLVGSYPAAQTTTTYAGGVSLPSNAKNGLWNFGSGDDSDRAIGGITTGVDNGTRGVNIYAHLFNSGRKNIEKLQISYDIEKYRQGSNPAGFAVQMYYSMDGRNWTSAGDQFYTKFEADAATQGYAEVPGEVVPVSAQLDAVMQPGCDFYLAWNISVASGTTCNNAMALAIDNFRLKGELPAIPTAKHYVYAIDNTGYASLGLYAWGDSELFGAWPGESWVEEKTIGNDTYKVFLLDAEGGAYHLIFNNWNNGKQLPDYDITADRDYYFRLTDTTVEEINPTTDIQTVAGPEQKNLGIIYDLQGRRVSSAALTRGIYIMNGKKWFKR